MSAQSVVNAKQQQQQQQHSSIATRHCPSRTKDGSPAVSVVLELDELTNLQRHFDAARARLGGEEGRSAPRVQHNAPFHAFWKEWCSCGTCVMIDDDVGEIAWDGRRERFAHRGNLSRFSHLYEAKPHDDGLDFWTS